MRYPMCSINIKSSFREYKIRSCFKFIPRQIETYVEADWSPRYAVNSGLLTKIKDSNQLQHRSQSVSE